MTKTAILTSFVLYIGSYVLAVYNDKTNSKKKAKNNIVTKDRSAATTD